MSLPSLSIDISGDPSEVLCTQEEAISWFLIFREEYENSVNIIGNCSFNIAFLTSLVSKQFTATQYALLTSFMMLPGKVFSGFSGILADYFQSISGADYGWMLFFIFTSMLAIPAIILISLNKSLIQR